jgi:MFS family permease
MSKTDTSFRKFLFLWSGSFIAAIGSGLTAFGLSVYVFQQTGMASATSLVALFAFLPMILLSPLAGILADRYDRRLLLIIGDSFSATGLVYILWCMTQGEAALWQICIGVTISSVFSSLLGPAFNATVTDLLTKDQYTRASGLMQLSSSARYLISPLLAGILLAISNIKLLLVIDICTLCTTVLVTLVVRRGMVSKKTEQTDSFFQSFKEGWDVISKNRGIFLLVWITALITFCIGFIQTLVTPLILSFSDSTTLGVLQTVAASGMLVTSLMLGLFSIKGNYVKLLSVSLFLTGLFMAMFGLRENLVVITIFGFLLFAMLPFANTSLDYLIRTNIGNETQGRTWGLIGVISQLGYVPAFMLAGPLADYVFSPLMQGGGTLALGIGKIIGTGSGRGIGLLIITAGLLLCLTSIYLYHVKAIRLLEKGVQDVS